MSRLSYIIVIFFVFTSFLASDVSGQKKAGKNIAKFKFLYSEALKFKYNENYLVAVQHFEECIKLMPNSSASAYQLSIVYIRLNESEKALYYINYALDLYPKNEWYILQKASIAGFLGKHEIYESSYKILHEYFPDNPVYTYELAIIYFKNKKYRNSLRLLDFLEEELGIIESISFLKNNIYLELKEYKLIEKELLNLVYMFSDSVKYIDMLGEYYLSLQHYNNSLETYNSGLTQFPNSKKLNIKIAQIYALLGDHIIGYNYLLKGIGTPNLGVERQFNIAKLFIDDSQISRDQIIAIYREFIINYKSVKHIENSFINFLLEEKELSLAETEIKNIFKDSYENFQLWNYLFSIYLSQNRVEELNSSALEAVNYFPNQPMVYFYSGYSYFLLKDYFNATSNLLTGIDYVFENDALELDFYLYLAESFHALSQHSKSDLYFDKYLSIDSSNAYLLNNYAYYLSQREKKIDKAFKLSRKSIEIEPLNPSFLDTYAWIYYLKEDFKNALFYIEKAYKFGGNTNAVICEHYGYILLKSDRREEAVIRLKQSLKLNKNNTSLQKKLESFN